MLYNIRDKQCIAYSERLNNNFFETIILLPTFSVDVIIAHGTQQPCV
jgi:hypothetical protein